MSSNRITGAFVVVCIAVGILSLLSFIQYPVCYIAGYRIKKVNLFSDVVHTAKPMYHPRHIQPANDTSGTQVTAAEQPVPPVRAVVDFSDDSTGLLKFFQSLDSTHLKGKKTRIAYFGDSMIEGDLVTSDFRNYFQSRFGGKGVGFVPVTSITAGFRRTILHTFSEHWTPFSFNDQLKNNYKPIGLSGYVFYASLVGDTLNREPEWIKYSAPLGSYRSLSSFRKAKLYFGQSGDNNFLEISSGGKETFVPLKGADVVNEVLVSANPTMEIKLGFYCKDSVALYGLSFDSDSGVYVDNYSFRGNSGLALTSIPFDVARGFDKLLDYRLVILHYGLNVANYTTTNLSWYAAGMTRYVNYIRHCFPHASILVIGVSDKSYKNDEGVMETDPSVPLLVEVQKKVAQQEGVAFWNLYEAMGGYNSMVEWVERDTAYANKDYTHPNYIGARRIAEMLYNDLMKKYEEYLHLKTGYAVAKIP